MIDLVDRKRLLNSRVYSIRSRKPNYEKMYKNLVNDILTAPAVDTERHAHWEQLSYIDEENGVYQCSNCKEEFVLISGSPKENGYEYCPHCGCKMDGEIHRCGDCIFIDTDCKDYVDENETFSEVGGCEKFKRKGKNL